MKDQWIDLSKIYRQLKCVDEDQIAVYTLQDLYQRKHQSCFDKQYEIGLALGNFVKMATSLHEKFIKTDPK